MKNSSDFVYKDLIINSAGEEKKTIEKITPHQSTDYLNFENAYRYAFVELKINGDTFTIQPIDYLGEEKLDPGRYTYEIKAKDSGTRYNRLDLVLNKN